MRYRPLWPDDPSRRSGANVFGWTADKAASFAVLAAATEAGMNDIDPADVYSRWTHSHSGGESETIIGRWLNARPGKRDKLVLITKVGSNIGTDASGRPANGFLCPGLAMVTM